MKRFTILILALFAFIGTFAQNISVADFQLRETDMTAASRDGRRIDQNGQPAALIRIETTETGFVFEAGALGIVDSKQETGEVWVWVPRASRKITIKHPKLGVLYDYRYPLEIEAERTYWMKLTTAKIETIIKEEVQQQYLAFEVSPANATLEVDDQIWKLGNDGTAMKFVHFGTYTYRVQAKGYHPDAGKVTVNDPSKTQRVTVTLRPNFGWIEVPSTANLQGASVYVDNSLVGEVPCKSEALSSGQHSVRIVKEMFETYSEMVTVSDNETTRLTPTLKADFAEVTLKVDADAEIWVNNELKGVRSWTGSLGSGSYKMECKQTNHETSLTTQEITPSMGGQTLTLPAPRPIYGSLNVESTPFATLYIDGKAIGETPTFIPEILIGTHELRLTKTGYAEYSETITIAKGERKQVKATLDDKDYDKIAKQGDDYFDAKNYEEALKCYREAAEHGNAVGQNGMGRLYTAGFAVQQDYVEAVKWYRLAALQGLDRAQNNLGWLYVYGQGVDKDYGEALRLFRMSAGEYSYSQCGLGFLYQNGYGVTQDYAEALKWFRKAAEQEDANAESSIGHMYYSGLGVTQDYAEALRWYRKAADQDNIIAQINIGFMYEKGQGVNQDFTEAVKWFRKAADQGNPYAQCNLGVMYEAGNGVTKNYSEAVKWYRKAAEQGDARGQCCLGVMYANGYGVTKDYSEALKWYRKAADQGYASAQLNLGYLYEKGNGVSQDYSEAMKWYRKAADQGNAGAQCNIGVMYHNGTGVTKDYAEAIKWYRKAAEQGNSPAQNNMGILYEYGNGVTKSISEAKKWYKKAADQGNEKAQQALERLK